MKKIMLLLLTVFVFLAQPVLAEVVTTQNTAGYADYLYIAGNPNNYPIEYYDDDANAYKGVIPDLLSKISEHSGLNFVYINGNKNDNHKMGENLQADIISSADGITSYGKGYLELISYEKNGEIIKSGLAFTAITDDAMEVETLLGEKVKLVEGSYRNIKITTPEDLAVAEGFLTE